MKRLFLFLVVFALLVPVACAETAVAAQNGAWGIDWTQVLVAVIGVVATALSAFLARICTVYVAPWLAQRNLTGAAAIVINAVEAALGRGGGNEKWLAALEKMRERGFDVDSQVVIDALKAAWLSLNLEQIAVGIKDPPEETDAQ